ncbi:aminoglycoside phosphotransferase family protein [Kribbella sp. NPDC026611]|uniref:phosphotransferase family protein n=1 Tax=Kribbella sp. NPDC026611 TaxID=3154911 RepID=UPI0033EADC0C
MEAFEVSRAVATAGAIAASVGVVVEDAVVLHNSNKLALRLVPGGVFARVAPEGEEVAEFEVQLARELGEIRAPVARPWSAEVYRRDGFVVTLWEYYEPVASEVEPVEYARALERLHDGMRKVELTSPRFTDRVAEAQKIVAEVELSPELTAADRVFLGGRLRDLREAIEGRGVAEQLLHGEPHPGNLLGTTHGPLFIDFETCCRGPVEFDLAHVPEAVCEHYRGVDQALLDDCRQLVLAMVAVWRWDRGDQFPNGRQFGEELLRILREGPPWPTLDAVVKRVEST